MQWRSKYIGTHGGKAQAGICGFPRERVNGGSKNYIGGIPIACPGGASLMVETSSCTCEIQDVFRGIDTARFLKSTP